MVVRLYGDTAIVTARADVKGHQLGEDFSGPYRYTRVWVRRSRPLAGGELPGHSHAVVASVNALCFLWRQPPSVVQPRSGATR